jgi:peptidoglycan hydrolase CwlO-like protein
MGKLDKAIETRENEIQELAESEEKSAQKEKKYFMQIENYNKKIEGLKGEAAKTQKNMQLLKKEIKVVESVRMARRRRSAPQHLRRTRSCSS